MMFCSYLHIMCCHHVSVNGSVCLSVHISTHVSITVTLHTVSLGLYVSEALHIFWSMPSSRLYLSPLLRVIQSSGLVLD